jgi:hypothetical protein
MTDTTIPPKAAQSKNDDNKVHVQTFDSIIHKLPPIKVIADLNHGMKLISIGIDDLREQDLNARTMTNNVFQQLADNIKKTGTLESIPLCAVNYDTNRIEIISGHHRVRAARAAGLSEINVLLYSDKLSKSQIIAKQLAHNSISGKDDPEIIKQLFLQISDAESKLEAFIDPKDLDIQEPDRISIDNITTEVPFRKIAFLFLDHQLESFKEASEEIEKDTTLVGAIPMEHYEKFREAIQTVATEAEIVSVGMIISKMCDIVIDHYRLSEGDEIEIRPTGLLTEEEEKVGPKEEEEQTVYVSTNNDGNPDTLTDGILELEAALAKREAAFDEQRQAELKKKK